MATMLAVLKAYCNSDSICLKRQTCDGVRQQTMCLGLLDLLMQRFLGPPSSFTAVWDDFSGRWCCWRDVWKVTLPWSWSALGIFLWDDNFCVLPRWFNLMWFVVSSAHLWNSRASEMTFCQTLLKRKFGPSNPLPRLRRSKHLQSHFGQGPLPSSFCKHEHAAGLKSPQNESSKIWRIPLFFTEGLWCSLGIHLLHHTWTTSP